MYLWGKIHFVLGLLARDIANHSYAPNTPLTQALNPLQICKDTDPVSENALYSGIWTNLGAQAYWVA